MIHMNIILISMMRHFGWYYHIYNPRYFTTTIWNSVWTSTYYRNFD